MRKPVLCQGGGGGMSLIDLPSQSRLVHPEGEAYAARVTERSRPVLANHPSLLDQPYGPDYWQKVDVFFPEAPPGAPPPIILFAHGGSWIAGCKEWMAFMATALSALPAIFVSVSYRLAPECLFPGPVEDCLDAIAWIYDRADSLGGDKERIFVGGHSAGGHLMTMAALNHDGARRRRLPDGLIKGCLAVSSPFDLRALASAADHTDCKLLRDSADADAASPILHVSPEAPPFLITIGEHDFSRVREQGVRMRNALASAGAPVVFQDLPGHDHFATNERSLDRGHPWLNQVTRMLSAGASNNDRGNSVKGRT